MSAVYWFVLLSSGLLFLMSVIHLALARRGLLEDQGVEDITLNAVWQSCFYLCTFLMALTIMFLE